MKVVLIVAISLKAIATLRNWKEMTTIERVLYPLWIFGLYLPNF